MKNYLFLFVIVLLCALTGGMISCGKDEILHDLKTDRPVQEVKTNQESASTALRKIVGENQKTLNSK